MAVGEFKLNGGDELDKIPTALERLPFGHRRPGVIGLDFCTEKPVPLRQRTSTHQVGNTLQRC